ncbi:hypothetical protein CH35J_011764 [Colletotrichum higginsianum]|uniref:Abscisic acid ABA receptor n=1 Tax=Colletotrichum higginsianum TaxID=80884 RepID=A0A4T0VF78_9PEZI|nr:hypothetical protein CH35J_011764 [Colletotrichum higginsianum]
MDPHPLPTYLSKVLALSPPQSTHPPSTLTGPLTSHTGLAYLFLAVSADHPRLQVHSYPAIHWARAYISNIPTPSAPITPFAPGGGGDDDDDRPSPAALGLLSDGLAGPAVRACVTKDLAHVRFFLALLAPVVEYILRAPTAAAASSSSPSPAAALHAPSPLPPLPTCLLHGLAGTLYLLRLIRHWVPFSAPLVSRTIVHVSDYLLSPSTPWTCPSPSSSPADRHGVSHGVLGTLTQLVLTTPPLAPSLAPRLSALLDLQLPDGDWPSPRDQQQQHHHDDEDPPETHASAPSGGVGFTSGPQGLVISLLSLRPFFPALQDRIDEAVRRAREFLWARVRDPGSSREANLFRGVLGTALAFPKGPQRTRFLALAASPSPPPETQPSSSTTTAFTTSTAAEVAAAAVGVAATPGSLMTSPSPGSAWAHSVSERELPRMILYNDV